MKNLSNIKIENTQKFTRLLRRAIKAGPDEWSVRINQKIYGIVNGALAKRNHSLIPREGHLRALGTTRHGLNVWWKARGSGWFLDSTKRARIQRYFKDHDDLQAPIFQWADRVMIDEFPLLGHGPIKLKGKDRWRSDPVLGISAPKLYHGRIRYLDANQVGDSKRVWEPNRFGWAYWLGMAYSLSGEKEYAEKFRELTLDWFEENPYPQGINYCSALELGIRAYAWLWALYLFHDYVAQDSTLLDKLLSGIWVSCQHIEHNLSYYFAPNTHLLGEAFALFACGVAFPEFSQSMRWRQLGVKILAREAERQFHSDGTHRELSSCYHLYATDFYLQSLLISRQTGHSIEPQVEAVALKSAIRLAQLAPADLQLPQFNDCDGGRLTWFCNEPLDAGPSLLAAKQLWDHPLFSSREESCNGYHLWMCQGDETLDNKSIQSVASINAEKYNPQAKPDSGIVSHLDPAGDYLLFRSGSFGYMDCGHSHDAPTSFILHLAGQPLIVDSGTGCYTQSHEIRKQFRSAYGKNILLVNGQGPSIPGDWFNWQRKSQASLKHCETFQGGFLCQGQHESYSEALGFRVEISRQLVLYDQGVLVVIDQWKAEQPISCKLALTLHPRLTPEIHGNDIGIKDGDGNEYSLTMHHFGSNLDIHAGPQLAAEANISLGASGDVKFEDCHNSNGNWIRQPSGETLKTSPVQLSLTKAPYSPAYGVVGETNTVECDFATSTQGCVLTFVSRTGKILGTTIDKTAEMRFSVSPNDSTRTQEGGGHPIMPLVVDQTGCSVAIARLPKGNP